MEIYKFIDSTVIRDYWKGVGFIPDPLQSAYLIFSCDNLEITLKEKQAAYSKLLKESDNYIIKPRPWFNRECSLADYLKILLNLQNTIAKVFFTPGENVSYTGKIYASKCNDAEPTYTSSFKTFEELKDSIPLLNKTKHIVISRSIFGYEGYPITLSFNHNFEVAGIGILGESADDKDGEILFGLNAFYFDFPFPFKQFDIVYSHLYGPEEPLLIIESLNKNVSERERLHNLGDDTDMCIRCTSVGGYIGTYPLLSLDYYEKQGVAVPEKIQRG